MGAIAPIDFEDPNITLPFEGCKIDKLTSKIAISTHRFEFLKTPLLMDLLSTPFDKIFKKKQNRIDAIS